MSVAAGAAAIALMTDRFAPISSATATAPVCVLAPPARGEAQAAFPHVIGFGLPVIQRAREQGGSEEEAKLDALMAIMSTLEDTSLLQTGGRPALAAARAGAGAVLDAGGAATRAGCERLRQLDVRLRALHASPRGSAVYCRPRSFWID